MPYPLSLPTSCPKAAQEPSPIVLPKCPVYGMSSSTDVCPSAGCSSRVSGIIPVSGMRHSKASTHQAILSIPRSVHVSPTEQQNDASDPKIQSPSSIPSQKLLPSSSNPTPKHRALDLHIDLIKRTHNRLNPILIHLRKERLDRLFCRWGFGIRSYGCACTARIRRRRLSGTV